MRNAIHVAMLAWSAPVFAVAAGGLGLTTVAALIVGLCLAAFVASLASPALHRRVARGVTRPLAVALVVAAAVAIFRIGTLAVFMADVNRVQYSSQPDDAFRRAPVTADLILTFLEHGHRLHDPLVAHI